MHLGVMDLLADVSGSEIEVWRSRLKQRIPDFRANKSSSYGYYRRIVLICMLRELSWVSWNTSAKLYSGPVGDLPNRS